MDLMRLQDNSKHKVQVCFWDSMVLGYATAANLLREMNDGLSIQTNPILDGWAQHELGSSFIFEERERERDLEHSVGSQKLPYLFIWEKFSLK